MIVAAIKCSMCGRTEEMDKGACEAYAKVPEGWAQIRPTVFIAGSKVKDEKRRKAFDDRREKLRNQIQTMHLCPDCIEEVTTGRKSVKITDQR